MPASPWIRRTAKNATPEPATSCGTTCRSLASGSSGFGGRLTWREPQAGAIGLVKYDAPVASLDIADRVRTRQSTLIVPGVHVGMEGHLRLWLGGREDFLREGLRRVAEELKPLFD